MLCFLFCVSATLTRLSARIIRCITCGLTYTCAHTYTHMCIRTYIHSHIYLPILARSNTYTYTWVYIYITTNTNTHIYITDTHMYLLIVHIEVDINALRDSKSWSKVIFCHLSTYMMFFFTYPSLSVWCVCMWHYTRSYTTYSIYSIHYNYTRTYLPPTHPLTTFLRITRRQIYTNYMTRVLLTRVCHMLIVINMCH